MLKTSVYCPYVINLIVNQLAYIKDKNRRDALESVLKGVVAVNNYYDRKGDREDDYIEAEKYSEIFLNLCK